MTDGDGVDDANDAFPDDVAASVDSDGDGHAPMNGTRDLVRRIQRPV